MILIIDNYDSFVFNIRRYVQELGAPARVVRNDALEPGALPADVTGLIISPGPCGPHEAGVSLDLIARWSGRLPILGVCLGHQCIGAAFGAHVVRAREPLHGEASRIYHQGQGIFAGVPDKFSAGRYHSLIVELDDASASPLEITARSEKGEIMALQHRTHPTFGVQFHPESVLTEHGHRLIGNFLDLCR